MPLSLEEQLRAVNVVTVFGRLFALDRVRTDYLESVEQPIPDEDIEVLSDLTDEMARILREADDRARNLLFLIHSYPFELEESYYRILSTAALSEDQRERLDAEVGRQGGL